MKRLKTQLQVEIDTAFLYEEIAKREEDRNVQKILRALADIEMGHANAILKKIKQSQKEVTIPDPSFRAKLQLKLSSVFGKDYIIGNLMDTEKYAAQSLVKSKLNKGEQISGFEHNHLRIIEAINKTQSDSVSGSILSRFEKRHRSVGGNAVRAAVLGANDGLVSNMSLVMGVAGASAQNNIILLTGIAGLLAGAISMALGEWLSVQSSRELYLRQIQLEEEELEMSPEDEKKELVLLYQAKGMDANTAKDLANKVFENKETALETLITEELGIDKEELGGSAWEAAFVSFFLFAIGAIIPVIPYFFTEGYTALYISIAGSILGLFVIGASITLFTGRSVFFSGFRQVSFGLAAAAITYTIGTLIGVSIAG